MIKIEDKKISIIDDYNQIFEFIADENGDYYFSCYSPFKNDNNYSFSISCQHFIYNCFKRFIEQEINYMKDDRNILCQTPYFIINNSSVRIADQNKHITDSEYVEFDLLEDEIRIILSKKFPTSIRVTGVGRMDFYPFFIPVIDLFNNMQNIESKFEFTKTKKRQEDGFKLQ